MDLGRMALARSVSPIVAQDADYEAVSILTELIPQKPLDFTAKAFRELNYYRLLGSDRDPQAA